ncbi:MAG: D-tyrosyl-tRNA(Tyr) deacylase [Prevotellaceae bacterium]|jgi:D-tyrosyl-tRNA(Tyr) deacylase|nr:D-tyrosyl-tRNA(Tyr) deacylase [Prevotellaceae bacterium]
MRALIQRVSQSSVTVNNTLHSKIGKGLLILLGIEDADTDADIDLLTGKIVHLRIFDDQNGIMNHSVSDIDGEIMLVSQFTLYANTKKGNRPSYIGASKPDFARPMYEKFHQMLESKSGKTVRTGIFGADMQITLTNDGPVTIWIDSKV